MEVVNKYINMDQNYFYPRHFWISPSIIHHEKEIIYLIHQINPKLNRTFQFGDETTLHIGSKNEVVENFNSSLYFVTQKFLLDTNQQNIPRFFLPSYCKQRISLCLYGKTIGFSGFDKEQMLILIQRVLLLGGSVESNHNLNKIDCIIAHDTISPAIISASQVDIPIVNSSWLSDTFSFLEEYPYGKYPLLPFSNLVFSSSDLDPLTARQLKQYITENGGIWSDSLNSSVHFLIASHLTMTPKIKLALRQNVPIVKPQWIKIHRLTLTMPNEWIFNIWCQPNQNSELFNSLEFYIDPRCDDIDLLQSAITSYSGTISTNQSDGMILIVPPNYQALALKDGPNALDNISKQIVGTTYWVWACISLNKVLLLTENPIFQPFKFPFLIGQLANWTIILNQIPEPIKSYYAGTLRMLGATVIFSFSKNAKVIISDHPNESIIKAAKGRIPIIKSLWITLLVEQGIIPPFEGLLVGNNSDFEKDQLNEIHEICSQIKMKNIRKKPKITTALPIPEIVGEETMEEYPNSPQVNYQASQSDSCSDDSSLGNDILLKLIEH